MLEIICIFFKTLIDVSYAANYENFSKYRILRNICNAMVPFDTKKASFKNLKTLFLNS